MTSASLGWRWGQDLAPLREILAAGGMLAIPTESSYGLGVDPRSEAGVATVFRFKRRSSEKPLPIVLGELTQMRQLGADPDAPELRELLALWPAPLTVVVPIERALPATAGGCTAAVRVPAHPRLRDLLRDLGRPLTATSANPSNARPVTGRSDLTELLREWPSVIVDDGDLPGGLPSTIVETGAEGVRVLRAGAYPLARLQRRISRPVFSAVPVEIPADDRPERR
jgi:L-threonylcarbamoyladenylate synthase